VWKVSFLSHAFPFPLHCFRSVLRPVPILSFLLSLTFSLSFDALKPSLCHYTLFLARLIPMTSTLPKRPSRVHLGASRSLRWPNKRNRRAACSEPPAGSPRSSLALRTIYISTNFVHHSTPVMPSELLELTLHYRLCALAGGQ
jgi:hypothetical protein